MTLKPLTEALPPLAPNAAPVRRAFPCQQCRVDIGRNVALCPTCVAARKGIAADPQQHWSDVDSAGDDR